MFLLSSSNILFGFVYSENTESSKSFKCHLCGYQTSRKSDHNRHLMSVHSQKPPVEKEKHLKCDKCSYATHRRGDLNRHLVNVHTEAGKNKVKDFKCDHCEYATTRRSDLERHVSGIHFRYGRYTQAAAAAQAQNGQTTGQVQIQTAPIGIFLFKIELSLGWSRGKG